MSRKYSVYVTDTDERIDKRGLPLHKAKALARIGSQYGQSREVVRGASGITVRVYEDGERIFPVTNRDLKDLYETEYPKEL